MASRGGNWWRGRRTLARTGEVAALQDEMHDYRTEAACVQRAVQHGVNQNGLVGLGGPFILFLQCLHLGCSGPSALIVVC